ncbi:MAG: thiamine-phosphate kinase [Kiritimatiellae bacterium]|nr:thiamine-phosphate kinase [Kiritimatiellia bacterium]
MPTLRDIGEVEAIRRLARLLGASTAIVGIGDDAAVVRAEGSGFDWLLTSDPVIEGTHFLPDAPRAGVGHKAVGRVLSDIAAMGGEPLWILLDVVAPPATDMAVLEEIYRGAQALAARYEAAIIGGDLSSGVTLELHAFGVGRVPEGAALLRSGAKPGDLLYVTGELGGSRAGRHLSFEPRVTEGLWLREAAWPTAMIDVSDGLATDLRHLAAMSNVGAEIEAARLPVSAAARADGDGRRPLDRALTEGEDFELLFTIPPGKQAFFESAWSEAFDLPCTRIGRMTSCEDRIELMGEKGERADLAGKGYEHFAG